jgi:biopolymer transport protein ExbD
MAMRGTVLDRRETQKKTAGLNLVSLMDIFTILVFFLLMNSGDSQEIEKAKFITLPDSQATGSFQNDLLIMIGDEAVLVNDEEIVTLEEVRKAKGKSVPALAAFLKEYASGQGELSEFEKKHGRPVTIMGDQAIPYEILKAVMASCSAENFRDIALAVNQVMKGIADVQGGAQ